MNCLQSGRPRVRGRRADTQMPLHESEAIVLQRYTLGEADRLVSFFSRTMGRVRGVAAGARKPKSRFGSTLERLSHIRIWFFESETRDLVRISQCDMIESFLDAFGDYASSIALALFSEITESVLPEREAIGREFSPAAACGAGCKAHGKVGTSAGLFRALDSETGGWLPALDRCARAVRCLDASGPAILRRALPRLFAQVPQGRDADAFAAALAPREKC